MRRFPLRPWQVADGSGGVELSVTDERGATVCDMAGTTDLDHERAVLISRAPTALFLLERLVDLIGDAPAELVSGSLLHFWREANDFLNDADRPVASYHPGYAYEPKEYKNGS